MYSKKNRQTSAKAPLCRAEKLNWNRRVGAVLAFKVYKPLDVFRSLNENKKKVVANKTINVCEEP